MDWFSNISNIVVTVGATISALVLLLKYARGPMLRWLKIAATTPEEVKDTLGAKLDEILNLLKPPSDEDIVKALQTLELAGLSLGEEE